ncbi:hypothetical protein GQ53DRAFT_782437 [Thozetella sp. PMI_491]|nr:hypothetical protein GQ53DRAFT_782437 [Thozetella sp. PMI_491]
MRMSTILNNTRVRNILDCPSNTTAGLIGCQGASGSVYSTTEGSFKQVFSLADWNVTVVDAQPNDGTTTVVQGYDSGNFPDGPAVVPDYPIEVWAAHAATNMSAIALGPKSSTVQRFVAHGLAPTSRFSMDYGSRSELYPRDGQVIFGGVNDARFDSSKKTEFAMWGAGAAVNCPLQVLVSDVILGNKDGNFSLFSDPDAKVSACIDTIQNSFTLTQSMFAKFQSLGKHIDYDGSNYSSQSFPISSEPLLGTLTIKLANGYTSVIPHHELVGHERGTDAQGKYAVVNNTRLQAAVASGQSDLGSNIPILGGVFLTSNYLEVDYEAGKFWLSPSTADKGLPDHITTTCTSSGNGTSPDAGASSGNGDSSLVVKIVVPIVAVFAIVGAIGVWLFLRRRQKQRLAKQAGETREMSSGKQNDPPSPADSQSSTAKLGLVNQKIRELDTEVIGSAGKPAGEFAELHDTRSIMNTPHSMRAEVYYEMSGLNDSYEMADTSPVVRGRSDSQSHWSPLPLQHRPSELGDASSPSSIKPASPATAQSEK